MEDEIASKLQTKLFKRIGGESGGCISTGSAYQTDNGQVFVKVNLKPNADIMFNGEYQSLLELKSFNFSVPTPLCVGKNYLVVEYLKMSPLRKHMSTLGENLAKLHLESADECEKRNSVKFGFDTDTCCGFLPMCNNWENNWVQFYATNRLDFPIRELQRKNADRQLCELWSNLQINIPKLFKNLPIRPSLLHGDLWSGNAAETETGPMTFDPSSFYGHSEYDLAIAQMFGGFSCNFFTSYHKIIPKNDGFDARQKLYLLFHHLNHWRHFGDSYRDSSLRLMSQLTEIVK